MSSQPPGSLEGVDDFDDLFSDTPSPSPSAPVDDPLAEMAEPTPASAPGAASLDPLADLMEPGPSASPPEDDMFAHLDPVSPGPAVEAEPVETPVPAIEPEPPVHSAPQPAVEPDVAPPAAAPIAAPVAPVAPPSPVAPSPAPAPVAEVSPADVAALLARMEQSIATFVNTMDARVGALEQKPAHTPAQESEMVALPPASTPVAPEAPAPVVEESPGPEAAPGPAAELTQEPADAEFFSPEPEPAEAASVAEPVAAPVAEPVAEPEVAPEPDPELMARLEAARAVAAERRAAVAKRELLDKALAKFESGADLTPIERALLESEGVDLTPPAPEPIAAPEPVIAPGPTHAPEPVDLAPAEAEPPYEPEPLPYEPATAQGAWEPEGPGAEAWDEAPAPDPQWAAPEVLPAPQGEEWADDFSHIAPASHAAHDDGRTAPPDRAPVDPLWAIGTRDSEEEEIIRTTQTSERLREDSRESNRRAKKGGSKVKLPRLPFSTLVKGEPLIIAVFSPKGGAGKSTTSVNLAALMAASGTASAGKDSEPPRILVLDGDIANGNLAIRVAGRLEPNLLELIDYLDKSGAPLTDFESTDSHRASMRDFVLWHEDLPNLNVLAAPDNPEAFDDFEVGDYERVLAMLGRFYDVIIIDCGTEVVMRSNQTWLRAAHQVFLLTLPERAALHSAGKAARVITRAGRGRPVLVTPDRLHIVMMRSDADLGFDPRVGMRQTFEWADGAHTTYFRDYDQETARANNAGDFLALSHGAYAEDVGELAHAAFSHYVERRRAGQGQ